MTKVSKQKSLPQIGWYQSVHGVGMNVSWQPKYWFYMRQQLALYLPTRHLTSEEQVTEPLWQELAINQTERFSLIKISVEEQSFTLRKRFCDSSSQGIWRFLDWIKHFWLLWFCRTHIICHPYLSPFHISCWPVIFSCVFTAELQF